MGTDGDAVLVWAEAPLSGTSTNPARTLGPGLISGDTTGGWAYLLGPMVGLLAAIAQAISSAAGVFGLGALGSGQGL